MRNFIFSSVSNSISMSSFSVSVKPSCTFMLEYRASTSALYISGGKKDCLSFFPELIVYF